jgi:hypothetical protein
MLPEAPTEGRKRRDWRCRGRNDILFEVRNILKLRFLEADDARGDGSENALNIGTFVNMTQAPNVSE